MTLLSIALLTAEALTDPYEIVRRMSVIDQSNYEKSKSYTWQTRNVSRQLDGAGKVKKQEVETFDVDVLYGRPYVKLVAKDDKPLKPDEAKKQDDKLRKESDKRARESDKDRENRAKEQARDRDELQRVVAEIPKAYHLTLLGIEPMGGRAAYAIQAVPRPGYKPFNRATGILPRLRGKLWVDVAELQIARVEMDVIETVSFGLVLARIGAGTRLTFEQQKINDEVWVPRLASGRIDARIAMMKKVRADFEAAFRNYRKYSVESRILTAGEPNP